MPANQPYFSHERRSLEADAKLARIYDLDAARRSREVAVQADMAAMTELQQQPAQQPIAPDPRITAVAIDSKLRADDHQQAQLDYLSQEARRHAA